MNIKTGEVVLRSGFSRQTISQYATLGLIPGAKRKKSGRWEFAQSPQLDDWLIRAGRFTRIRHRRQLLHLDEEEVRRLELKAAKLRKSPGSRHAKPRLLELTRAIAEKRAAISDHLTTRELANATRRSRRWITGRAKSIPGARRLKNRLVFEKSEQLSDWIHQERRLRDLERRLVPGVRFPRSRMAWVLLDTFRYEQGVLREVSQESFAEWSNDEQEEFAKRFRNMVREIQRATGLTI
jgi:DNA-binding transcriptional MerR regulator